MDLNDISTQLLFITIPINTKINTDEQRSGTGFLINCEIDKDANSSIPLLITNWHVVKNSDSVLIRMCSADEHGMPKNTMPITVEINGNEWVKFHNEELDIAVLPMGPIFNQLITAGHKFFYRALAFNLFPEENTIEEFSALEEVIFIGYPSGILDSHNLGPLIRKGITATPIWRDFEGKPRFVVDAGVFPGSSGSPVFIMNSSSYTTKKGIHLGSRLYFIGMLTTTFFVSHQQIDQRTYLGLGEVIKSTKVKIFIEKVLTQLNPD